VKNPAELVDMNRFVGREFLLWLWFESELYETNLSPSRGERLAMWLETQLTLANEGEETRVKSAMPGAAPEAKQALRQGKLPREARLRVVLNELEFSWKMKADDLAVGGLKVPAQLKAKDDKYEALYERMRLVEMIEEQLEALFHDFLALRLDGAWDRTVVPDLRRWARGKPIDEKSYASLKLKLIGKKARQAQAHK
jgi:hypothetical protein